MEETRTLEVGRYVIPEGCTIQRVGSVITVYEKKNRRKPGEYRCKDCKHFVKGHVYMSQSHKSMVCDLKPKRLPVSAERWIKRHYGVPSEMYYGANPYDKPCDKFEIRQ